MNNSLQTYLVDDPFYKSLFDQIRAAGQIRSVSLDITNRCNLRCQGCYYFGEGMDMHFSDKDSDLDLFIESEKRRGTNFITIVGGEPSMVPGRLKKVYNNFKISVATNGLIRIPLKGFEDLPIGVAIWGNEFTDSIMRTGGKYDLFSKALKNYKDDPRAFWYYTVAPGHAHQVDEVVERCIDNGNKVLFNYYSDIANLGGELDFHEGFDDVRTRIEDIINQYPDKILTTTYLNEVITGGKLMGESWGYDVCTNLSTDNIVNKVRLGNGNPYNRHFRAYNADFKTTRRCCTGIHRSCESCFDTWEHFSWIMINMRKHLGSIRHFANWLTSVYMFYLINRLVPQDNIDEVLRQIHQRLQERISANAV